MNVALIFAGGVGVRMNSGSTPKQFLKIYGKPIIIYTLEVFERCQEIDAICISCVASHMQYMEDLCKKFHINKVKWVVSGGETGQLSIYHGLCKIHENYPEDTVVLIHDGVRPIITEKLISDNIHSVKEHGSAVSCAKATETHAQVDEEGNLCQVSPRETAVIAKAPQSFFLKDIWYAHQKALEEGTTTFIDSASMMRHYNFPLHSVLCENDNIKVTNPSDYFIVKSILDAHNDLQAFGL